MGFEILDAIVEIEAIAVGRGIRELDRLVRNQGSERWRKLKGLARVRMEGERSFLAEIR